MRTNGRHRFTYETITLADITDPSTIVGAQLHTDSHHQFMEKLVENYLKVSQWLDLSERGSGEHDPVGYEREVLAV